MALNQTKFIQPIRSNTLYSSSTAAMDAINLLLPELKGNAKADGVKFAAKYNNNGKQTWLYGLYNQKANVFTFFDSSVENINAIKGDIIDLQEAIGKGGSVEEQITKAINALKGTLVEGDAKTLEAINGELDDIDAEIGSKADDSSVSSTTIWSAIEEVASEASAKIESLDFTDTAVEGSYVSSVSEADGIISVERVALPTVGKIKSEGKAIISVKQDKGVISAEAGDIAAAHVTVADASNKFTSVTVEDVLSEIDTAYKAADADLQNQIDAIEAAAKSYSIDAVTGEELTSLGTNVKEAFKLVQTVGEKETKVGEYIKIYKDSSLKNVALSGQTLNFTYILADGSESTVGVDVSLFLTESEFKNGLQVVNGKVSVKLAEGNESFLTVDGNGVKLSGVQAAINTAKAAATTKVVEGTDAGNNMTVAESTNTDGSKTYTINLTDVASAQGLAAEIDRANAAEKTNADAIAAEATTARAAEKANAEAIAALDGGNVKLSSDYEEVVYPTATTVTFTPVASESTIDAAINQVDSSVSQLVGEVLKNEETVAAALTKIKESAGFDTNAELTYQNTNYLNGAADLKSADVALDAEIKKLNDAIGEGGSVSTQITTAINALDSTVSGNGTHVDVTVTQVDGKITAVAVAESDIASATALTKEVTDRKDAINALDAKVESKDGTYVKVKVTEVDGIITDVNVTEDFSNIDCGTFE